MSRFLIRGRHWVLLLGSLGLLISALWMRSRLTTPEQTAAESKVPTGNLSTRTIPADSPPLASSQQADRVSLDLGSEGSAPSLNKGTVTSSTGTPTGIRYASGAKVGQPAELREAISLTREDAIRRRGDAYVYNSQGYGATLENGALRIATGDPRKSDRTILEYALEDIRRGARKIAEGGTQAPSMASSNLALSYDRGAVEERYVFSKESVEQSFVIKTLPEGSGDIVATGRVTTNLIPPDEGSAGEKLVFRDNQGEALSFSQAIAIDGTGRRLPLDLAYLQGRVSMTIPASWVAEATLPIVIDPVIGGPISLRTAIYDTGLTRGCDVAYNPADNLWFAVWTETLGSGQTMEVTGQFIRPTGAPLGTPFVISATTDRASDLCLSYAPAPINRFLVTWTHAPITDLSGNSNTIEGRVLSGTGAFVTSPFTVDDRTLMDTTPRSACDGTNWYVAWTNNATNIGTGTNIVGRFVSKDGVPGTKVDADQNVLVKSGTLTGVAFSNGVYVIAWAGGSTGNGPHTTYARTMTPAGVMSAAKSISAGDSFDLAPSNGKFFIFGNLNVAPNTKWSYILDSSLNATAVTAVAGERLCTVGSLPGWYSLLPDGTLTSIQGYSVTEAGVVAGPVTLCGPGQYTYVDGAAWCAVTNEILLVYRTGLTLGSYRFEAQRYSLGALLGVPSGLTASPGAGGISLQWTPTTGATSYNAKRRTSPTGSYTTVGTGILDTTWVDTSVVGGTTYYYIVTAVNTSGESVPSNEVTVVAQAVLPAPTGVFTGFNNGSISVFWSVVSGAMSYSVKRATTSSGPFTTMQTGVTTLSYTNTGLTPGSTYWYVVSAVNAAGESANSTPVQGTAYGPVGVPTNLIATPGNNKVTLSWTAPVWVTGGYYVWRATSAGGTYSSIISGYAQNSYVDTTAVNATRYWYYVTAWGLNGMSGASNIANAAPMSTVPAAPTNVTTTPGLGQITISWNSVTGADSYTIKQATPYSTSTYSTIVTGVSGVSYVKTGLTNGTRYWYKVSAVDYLGSSTDSAPVTGVPNTPIPATPTGLVALGLNGRVLLTWNSVAGAEDYVIGRSTTTGGPYTITGSSTTPSFADFNVIDGVRTYYVVAARNISGESLNSAEASAVPNPPATTGALFVVGNATTLGAGDDAIRLRLSNLGYTVTIMKDSISQGSDATGKAIVVISSTVASGNVTTKFTGVTVPVLNCEPSLMNPLGMTGNLAANFGPLTGQIQLSMVTATASHSMAAGLSGTLDALTPPATNTFTFGQPNANAVVIATAKNDPTRPVIFGYDSGSSMPVGMAPARRTGFFLNDTTAKDCNANGQALIDAAIRWTAGAPDAPVSIWAFTDNGKAHLTWNSVPGAYSYTILRAPISGGAYSQIKSGITATGYVDISVAVNTSYLYMVIAVNDAGFSLASHVFNFVPDQYVLAIVGRPYLRTRENQDKPAETIWNVGNYSVDKWPTTLQVTSAVWTVPQGVGLTSTAAPTSLIVHLTTGAPPANAQVTRTITYKPTLKDAAGNIGTTTMEFPLEIGIRPEIQLRYFFPTVGQPGALDLTKMTSKPNVFDAPGPRTTARQEIMNRYSKLISYWRDPDQGNKYVYSGTPGLEQANLSVYPGIDALLEEAGSYPPIPSEAFNPNGQFMAGEWKKPALQKDSDWMTNNVAKYYGPREYKVLFFKGLWDGEKQVHSYLQRSNHFREGALILIADSLPEAQVASTIAFHIAEDLEGRTTDQMANNGAELLDSQLNNPRVKILEQANTAATHHNLLQPDPALRKTTWLTPNQCSQIYKAAKNNSAITLFP